MRPDGSATADGVGIVDGADVRAALATEGDEVDGPTTAGDGAVAEPQPVATYPIAVSSATRRIKTSIPLREAWRLEHVSETYRSDRRYPNWGIRAV
jgi:hypothetical protein